MTFAHDGPQPRDSFPEKKVWLQVARGMTLRRSLLQQTDFLFHVAPPDSLPMSMWAAETTHKVERLKPKTSRHTVAAVA
jgi:hypothetical protein